MTSTKLFAIGFGIFFFVFLGVYALLISKPDIVNDTSKPAQNQGQLQATIGKSTRGENTPAEIGSDVGNSWDSQTRIGIIVAEQPETARIFELVGIDYCCGGNVTLQIAAKEKQLDPDQLLRALSIVGPSEQNADHRNWRKAELGELIDHIVARHHGWLRQELPPLVETTNTVFQVHGENHSELEEVNEIVKRVHETILPHLEDEEDRVFPAVRSLADGKQPANISALLEEMKTEHDELGADLHRLHALTDGFAEPAGACAKYREMLAGLKALESDLHTHVHLENNILLPRALNLLETANR